MNPGHQPERFLTFNYLPNQRSFTVKDTNYVFHLDRYGGWYDEYGNYYNEHGEADDPPSSSESYSEGGDRSFSSSGSQDEYEKQFGRPGYFSEDEEQEKDIIEIAANLAILQGYPKESLVRVYFQNLGFHSSKTQVLSAYKQSVPGILNVILDKRGNKNSGTGYFIMSSPTNAGVLIHLEGKKLIQRPLYFTAEKFEDNLCHSITEDQLKKEDKPKYLPKAKQETPIEEPKILVIPWRWYRFEKDIFPNKSSFKLWMHDHGLIFEQDFKNIEKIENDPQKKWVKTSMKETTFKSINGLEYEGRKVEFFPLDS